MPDPLADYLSEHEAAPKLKTDRPNIAVMAAARRRPALDQNRSPHLLLTRWHWTMAEEP